MKVLWGGSVRACVCRERPVSNLPVPNPRDGHGWRAAQSGIAPVRNSLDRSRAAGSTYIGWKYENCECYRVLDLLLVSPRYQRIYNILRRSYGIGVFDAYESA